MPSRREPVSAWSMVLLASAVYLLWVAATYLLEGRSRVFQQVDPAARARYVLVANGLVGLLLAAVATHRLRGWVGTAPSPNQAARLGGGVLAVLLTLLLAARVAADRGVETAANAFVMVFPVSVAEVLVCWLLVGEAAVALAQPRSRFGAAVVQGVAADLAFAVYHVAHSPPFNTPGVIAFLLLPGAVTTVAYLLTRSVWVAALLQTGFGIVGVIVSAPPGAVEGAQPVLYGLAAVSALALLAATTTLLREGPRRNPGALRSTFARTGR